MLRRIRSTALLAVAAGYISYAALLVASGKEPEDWRAVLLAPVYMPLILALLSIGQFMPFERPPLAMTVAAWSGYLLPLALARVARARRERRQRLAGARADAGLCSVCGYDLRASPDRCPECGVVSGRAAR